jgi:hypothetical protein
MSKTKAAEAKLPGVTLYARATREYQVAGKNKAEIKVECDIEDKDVYEAVHKMFLAGFRVYTQEDFKGEMLNVFREEVNQLEARVAGLVQENERKTRELALVQEELNQKREVLDGFGRQLRG